MDGISVMQLRSQLENIKEFDVKVMLRFYETAKHKRSYRCLVLHQLQRIADNTEKIKKLLSEENSPNGDLSAERVKEIYKKSLEDAFNLLASGRAAHATVPEIREGESLEEWRKRLYEYQL